MQRQRKKKQSISEVKNQFAYLVHLDPQFGTSWSTVPVDSPKFQSWAGSAGSFSFDGSTCSYTARNEKRRGEAGYWYAYKKDDLGNLYKIYIGKTDSLTWAKLRLVEEKMRIKIDPTYRKQLRPPEQPI